MLYYVCVILCFICHVVLKSVIVLRENWTDLQVKRLSTVNTCEMYACFFLNDDVHAVGIKAGVWVSTWNVSTVNASHKDVANVGANLMHTSNTHTIYFIVHVNELMILGQFLLQLKKHSSLLCILNGTTVISIVNSACGGILFDRNNPWPF